MRLTLSILIFGHSLYVLFLICCSFHYQKSTITTRTLAGRVEILQPKSQHKSSADTAGTMTDIPSAVPWYTGYTSSNHTSGTKASATSSMSQLFTTPTTVKKLDTHLTSNNVSAFHHASEKNGSDNFPLSESRQNSSVKAPLTSKVSGETSACMNSKSRVKSFVLAKISKTGTSTLYIMFLRFKEIERVSIVEPVQGVFIDWTKPEGKGKITEVFMYTSQHFKLNLALSTTTINNFALELTREVLIIL